MVPKLYKKAKVFCLGLVLLALMLAAPQSSQLAHSSNARHSQPTAILCLVGSFCGDIQITLWL